MKAFIDKPQAWPDADERQWPRHDIKSRGRRVQLKELTDATMGAIVDSLGRVNGSPCLGAGVGQLLITSVNIMPATEPNTWQAEILLTELRPPAVWNELYDPDQCRMVTAPLYVLLDFGDVLGLDTASGGLSSSERPTGGPDVV